MKKKFTIIFLLCLLPISFSLDWGKYNYGSDFNLSDVIENSAGNPIIDATFKMSGYYVPTNTKVLNEVSFIYDSNTGLYKYFIGASDTGTWKIGQYEGVINITHADGNYTGKAYWNIDYTATQIISEIGTSETNIINEIGGSTTNISALITGLPIEPEEISEIYFNRRQSVNNFPEIEEGERFYNQRQGDYLSDEDSEELNMWGTIQLIGVILIGAVFLGLGFLWVKR